MRIFVGAGPAIDKLGDFSFEGKTDGNLVEDEYTDTFVGADIWKVDDSDPRDGLMGSTIGDNADGYTYYDISTLRDSEERLSLRFFMRGKDTGGDYVQRFLMGLSSITVFDGGTQINAQHFYIVFARVGGVMKWRLVAATRHEGSDIYSLKFIAGGFGPPSYDDYDEAWKGLRIDYNWTTYTANFYYDLGGSGLGPNNDGVWLFAGSQVFNADSRRELKYVLFERDSLGSNEAYDQVYLDDLSIVVKAPPPTEITGVTSLNCSKRMGGNGIISANVRDLALANYSTNKDIIWSGAEVWDNDLTRPLWEGYVVEPVINYNWLMFQGFETLRTLEKVPANYSTILAEGEVTTAADDYIDDVNASFTDDLLTKPCTFTDTAGPTYEIINPNVSSGWLQSDIATPLVSVSEIGDYTDLANPRVVNWSRWYGSKAEVNGGLELQFTVTNAGSSTGFEIKIVCRFRNSSVYTDLPLLKIRDDICGSWELVIDPLIAATPIQYDVNYTFKSEDLAHARAHYFDGTTLKIFLDWGAYPPPVSNEAITAFYAEVKNFYSTLFTAGGVIYTIDARDSDTLTFTGQTPNADGVATDDRYKVGDYIHNNMNNIWAAISIPWLILDFDSSTLFDSSDYNSAYVLDVLNNYAKMSDREVWQAYDYIVKCKSSYDDSGIDLTEADVIHDNTGNWLNGSFTRNGREIIRSARIFGAGVTYVDTQLPDYPSPRGDIYSDSRIATQAQAAVIVANILTENSSPKEILRIMINCNSSITNIENLDIGKTIDVNLYSGTIAITAGLIREVHYEQTRGGPLYATLEIEVI